ncbi:SAM-dependent methyltransferase [Novosphingobium sp. 11B]
MMRPLKSLAPMYFEEMFEHTEDPWDLESSDYERAKYADTVRALGGRIYMNAFEIGCAKGILTQQLAPSCRDLLAVDVSTIALRAARARCVPLEHVSFANMAVPRLMPARSFDLVILSEVAYYWADEDLKRVSAWLGSHVRSGGDILLVHWTGATDYPQSGDDAVEKLRTMLGDGVVVLTDERMPLYRLNLWRRRS